jgi:SAM-dependent methyltransferase
VERTDLRATFDPVAELYDRARPRYPDAVVDDVVELASLRPGSRVLEVGCGTGQATVALADRGLDVVCVELGASLAAVARRNLARFPRVRVEVADFDAWEPDGAFDAVAAFTAWHWPDPATKYARAAAALRDGGSLCVVVTQHVLPAGGDRFWADVQADYELIGEADDPPPPPEAVEDLRAELAASGVFDEPQVRRHVWEVDYTADAYVDVLDTYSGHIAMAPEARRTLYDAIRRRIGDGTVRKTYLAIVHVARRR